MTLPTIEQLEAMLANVPPKPWTVAFRSDGSAYCSFGDPMAGAHLQINIGLDWDGRFDKHIAALIALAPTLAVQRIADAKRIAELEAAQVTVQEAARVLLGVFEDPEANAPQRFDWQSMYQEMTRDHNESMEICGTHDWPQTLVVALRAIAGHP